MTARASFREFSNINRSDRFDYKWLFGKGAYVPPGGGGGGVDRIRESDRYRSYRSYCTRIHKITFTYLLIDVYERGLQACVWSVL